MFIGTRQVILLLPPPASAAFKKSFCNYKQKSKPQRLIQRYNGKESENISFSLRLIQFSDYQD